MKTYATHDAQMNAYLAEPCPNCVAPRGEHQTTDGRDHGFCPRTGCPKFGESEHLTADDYIQVPNHEVDEAERSYARSRRRR